MEMIKELGIMEVVAKELESIHSSKDDKKKWKELVHMHYLTPPRPYEV